MSLMATVRQKGLLQTDRQGKRYRVATHLAVRTCLSASPTMPATVASVPNTVLKEAVDGRTGELQEDIQVHGCSNTQAAASHVAVYAQGSNSRYMYALRTATLPLGHFMSSTAAERQPVLGNTPLLQGGCVCHAKKLMSGVQGTHERCSHLVHMCCSTPRLSCQAFILAYECSSVLKEIRVGLQQDKQQRSEVGGAGQCSQISSVSGMQSNTPNLQIYQPKHQRPETHRSVTATAQIGAND